MFDNVCEPGYRVETPVSRAFVGRLMLSAASSNNLMMGAFGYSTISILSLLVLFSFFFLLFSFLLFFFLSDKLKLGQDQSWLRQTFHGRSSKTRANRVVRNLYGISETVTKRKNQGKMVRRGHGEPCY